MNTVTIEIQVQGTTLEQMQEICDRYEISVKKGSSKIHFKITAEDPLNFFWLGMNLISKLHEKAF